jgi:hypothetical protein
MVGEASDEPSKPPALMIHEQEASHEEWIQAYEAVYRRLPGEAHRPCPNCAQDALRVAFVGSWEERVG